MSALRYRWHWRARLPECHGETCHVTARGRMNSVRVVFLCDGWTVITSRYAVRRVRDE